MQNNNFLDFEQTKPAFVVFKSKTFLSTILTYTITINKFQTLIDSFKIYYEYKYKGNFVII